MATSGALLRVRATTASTSVKTEVSLSTGIPRLSQSMANNGLLLVWRPPTLQDWGMVSIGGLGLGEHRA
jgi:hypothetical protein